MTGPELLPGFTRVIAASIDPVIPPEVDASQLESVQEARYVYNHDVPKTGTAPFYEGGGHRAWNKWVFMTPFLFIPDFGDHYSEGVLREGVAWAYDVSDDGKTYIVHLNPDAHFTDGGPVTARSVKDAWEFGAWLDNQAAWGAILLHTGAIVGMDAVESGRSFSASGLTALDDHTLQIELKAKDPTWHLQMSMWMLGIFDADYAKANEDWEEHPVGVGAYDVKLDINTGDQNLIAAANPWLATPRIPQWVMPHVPETRTSLIMYENSELDIIHADSSRQPALYDPDHPLHGDLVERGSAGLWYVAFDTTHPPFDEIEMRKAFAHAADWDTIVPSVFGASEEWAEGIIQKGVPCYTPDTGYTFDPDLAQSQLAASSFGSAENVPTITVALSRPQWIIVFEIVQEQWRDELGVEINIFRREPGQQPPEVVELYRRSIGSRILDPSGVIRDMGLSTSGVVQGGSRHNNPEIDAQILNATELDLDDPTRCGEWAAAEKMVLDNYYYVPGLRSSPTTYLVQPWMYGWQATFEQVFPTLPWMQVGIRDRGLYQ